MRKVQIEVSLSLPSDATRKYRHRHENGLHEENRKMIEKRKDARLCTHKVMKYRLTARDTDRHCIGVTHNISESGTCLYLLDEVDVGDKITFIHRQASLQHESAVVQWVQKVQEKVYLAGMMFV